MNTLAVIVLVMNIENPPRAGGPAFIDGFESVELCEAAAKQIEKSYRSLVAGPNNFWMSHQCIEIKKKADN